MNRVRTWKIILSFLVVVAILQIILEGWLGIAAECKPVRDQNSTPSRISYYVDSISAQFQLAQTFMVSLSALELSDGDAFIMGKHNGNRNALWNIDLETQEVNWQTCATGVMSIGKKYIYVLDSSASTTRLRAYDKQTGIEDWQKGVDPWYPAIKNLEITPFGLLVTTHNHGNKRWSIRNLQTGRKEHTFRSDTEVKEFWIEQGFVVYDVIGADLIVAKGPVQWQTRVEFEGYPDSDLVTLILEKEIVLAYKQSPTVTQIAALNKYSGTILWQSDVHIVSNLAVIEGMLFFVIDDIELVAVDLETGKKSGSVVFSLDRENTLDEYLDITVSVDEGRVLTYFTNSHQLFDFYYSSNE
jgi:hypothetical protein